MTELADGWQRLDPRKLLLDPAKVLGQLAVPALIALVGLSTSSSGPPLWLIPLVAVAAVVVGTLPWLTTTYRITDTQLQLRSGVLNKKTSTAPLDRVRSVDLEASLLHRVLGMAKVQIGTGVDEERITLDAVSRERAAELRTSLLVRRVAPDVAPDRPAPPPEPEARLLAQVDWSWVRFAPFSLSRLVVVAGALGLLAQLSEDLPILDSDTLRSAWGWLSQFALALLLPALLVGALVSWVTVAVTGYVVQWWDFRLTREHDSLHVTSGLLTTRAISVEEARIRGVALSEPVLLRLVGGAELSTLATGVGSGGVRQVLPPCPREFARVVGEDVLGSRGPLAVPLLPHGRAARRRAHFRFQRVTLALTVAAVLGAWWVDLGAWLPLAVAAATGAGAAALGESTYRHLGHAVTDEHLVAGSGVLTRARTVLELEGIIGWVVSESWWQRRVGLATLTATTAAGAEHVVVRDLPLGAALAVADSSTPGLLGPFLVRT